MNKAHMYKTKISVIACLTHLGCRVCALLSQKSDIVPLLKGTGLSICFVHYSFQGKNNNNHEVSQRLALIYDSSPQ